MFGILRLAKAVTRNPWILVPVLGLMAAGFIFDASLPTPSENPLPATNLVWEARLARGSFEPRSDYANIHGMDYIRLRICLNNCEELEDAATGAPLATLFVQTLDGTETEVAFCADGLIDVDGTVYRVSNEDRLTQIINELAPKPRPRHAARNRGRRR